MRILLSLPDDWEPQIDRARGRRSRQGYLADLVRADLPKRQARRLKQPRKRGGQVRDKKIESQG